MDIFISYAREDEAFVLRLEKELQDAGRQVWIDTAGILVAEGYWERIKAAITSADNFVLILSPHSAGSEECLREVRFAQSRNKRIIPVLIAGLTGSPPEEVAPINWLRFPGSEEEFSSGVRQILRAVETDPQWVHEHTRLLIRATEWQEGLDPSRLLRGEELNRAHAWLRQAWLREQTAESAPAPTDAQISYIEASAAQAEEESRREARTNALLRARYVATLADARMSRGEYRLACHFASISWATSPNELAQKVLFDIANHPFEGEIQFPESVNAAAADVSVDRIFVGWGGEFRGGAKECDVSGRTAQSFLEDETVKDIQLSPDGKHVLTVSKYSGVKLSVWNGQGRCWEYERRELISAAAFSPDGGKVLLASWDGTVRVFQIGGEPLAVLQHPDFVYDAQFSNGGELILSVCRDGLARLWEASGKLIQSCKVGARGTAALARDGSFFVASHAKGAALWTRAGRRLSLIKLPYPASHLACSPDGRYVVTGQTPVMLWELIPSDARPGRFREKLMKFGREGVTCELRAQITVKGRIRQIAFSPDSRLLMVAAGPNDFDADYKRRSGVSTAKVLTVEGDVIADLGHRHSINSARFSPGGEAALTASKDRTCRIWRFARRAPAARLKHENRINAVGFLPGDRAIVVGSADGVIKTWSFEGEPLSSFDSGAHVATLAVSPMDELILTAGHSGEARLFDLRGTLRTVFKPDVWSLGKAYVKASFSPDGQLVLTTAYNTASLWSRGGSLLANFVHKEGGALTSTRFTPDGQWLLTAGLDKSGARLWRTSGQFVAAFPDNGYYVTVAEFWPDGKHVLTVGKSPKLWNTDGELVTSFEMPGARQVLVLTNALLLVPQDGQVASLWDLEGRLIAELVHEDYIRSAALSPDGFRILTAAGNRAALWDFAGNLLSSVEHPFEIDRSLFSATSNYVLSTASGDDDAALWDLLSPAQIIDYYQGRIPALTDAERQAYLTPDAGKFSG